MFRDNLQANIQRATDTCSNVLYHLQRSKFVATYPDKHIELVYATEQSEKLRSELSALIESIKSGDTDAPR